MKLFTSSGFDEAAKFVICGVPFDGNCSYRKGAAKGPDAIRDASWEIETYMIDKGIDFDELSIHDAGNLACETYKGLVKSADEFVGRCAGRQFVALGGEHSVTYPFVKSLAKSHDLQVLSIDAHLDLRESYKNNRDSNASVLRRISEEIGNDNLFEFGARCASREDWEYSKNISIAPMKDIRKDGVARAIEKLTKKIKKPLYLSIDMDIIDSCYAPGVGNPEVFGLLPLEYLELIRAVMKNCDVISADIVEVCPKYDNGATALLAAQTVFEIIGGWAEKA